MTPSGSAATPPAHPGPRLRIGRQQRRLRKFHFQIFEDGQRTSKRATSRRRVPRDQSADGGADLDRRRHQAVSVATGLEFPVRGSPSNARACSSFISAWSRYTQNSTRVRSPRQPGSEVCRDRSASGTILSTGRVRSPQASTPRVQVSTDNNRDVAYLSRDRVRSTATLPWRLATSCRLGGLCGAALNFTAG
jgi:hypothetical protein